MAATVLEAGDTRSGAGLASSVALEAKAMGAPAQLLVTNVRIVEGGWDVTERGAHAPAVVPDAVAVGPKLVKVPAGERYTPAGYDTGATIHLAKASYVAGLGAGIALGGTGSQMLVRSDLAGGGHTTSLGAVLAELDMLVGQRPGSDEEPRNHVTLRVVFHVLPDEAWLRSLDAPLLIGDPIRTALEAQGLGICTMGARTWVAPQAALDPEYASRSFVVAAASAVAIAAGATAWVPLRVGRDMGKALGGKAAPWSDSTTGILTMGTSWRRVNAPPLKATAQDLLGDQPVALPFYNPSARVLHIRESMVVGRFTPAVWGLETEPGGPDDGEGAGGGEGEQAGGGEPTTAAVCAFSLQGQGEPTAEGGLDLELGRMSYLGPSGLPRPSRAPDNVKMRGEIADVMRKKHRDADADTRGLRATERQDYAAALDKLDAVLKDPGINEVFVYDYLPAGTVKDTTARLYLQPEAKRFVQPQRKKAPAKAAAEGAEIERLRSHGAVEPAAPDASVSEILLVLKPNGSWRVTVDLRQLNSLIETDGFPLVMVDDAVRRMAGATFYSGGDASSAFFQIPLDPDSRAWTGFRTSSGLYQFTVLTMGVKCASAWLARAISRAYAGLETAVTYADDIRLATRGTAVDHVQDVVAWLRATSEAGIYLSIKKCFFLEQRCDFLGYSFAPGGRYKCAHDLLEPVLSWEVTRTPTGIRQFLGLCGYPRRFVPGFADLAAPLTDLLGKGPNGAALDEAGAITNWTGAHDQAVEAIKGRLTQETWLWAPDESLPYVVGSDAGERAYGAYLGQLGPDGKVRVLALMSKPYNKGQLKYSIPQRELLSLHQAVTKRWRHLLLGRRFLMYVDCAALTHMKTLEGHHRMLAWANELSAYDGQAIHVPRAQHELADLMTRHPGHAETTQARMDELRAELGRDDERWTTLVAADDELGRAAATSWALEGSADQGRETGTVRALTGEPASAPGAASARRGPPRAARQAAAQPPAPPTQPSGPTAPVPTTRRRKRSRRAPLPTGAPSAPSPDPAPTSERRPARVDLDQADLDVDDLDPPGDGAEQDAEPWGLDLQDAEPAVLEALGLRRAPGQWEAQVRAAYDQCWPYGLIRDRLLAAQLETPPQRPRGLRLTAKQLRTRKQLLRGLAEAKPAGTDAKTDVDWVKAPLHRKLQWLHGMAVHKGLLCKTFRAPTGLEWAVVVPPVDELRTEALEAGHDVPSAGHFGRAKTTMRLLPQVWWPHIRACISRHVKQCPTCALFKPSTEPLPPTARVQPSHVGHLVQLDLWKPGKQYVKPGAPKYVLIIQDVFSRWVELVPLPDKTANTVARAFHNEWLCRFGRPVYMATDQGTEFANSVMQRLTVMARVQHHLGIAYWPQGQGAVERAGQTVGRALARLSVHSPSASDWALLLPIVRYAMNSSVHAATLVSPAQVMTGPQRHSEGLRDDLLDDAWNDGLRVELRQAARLAVREAVSVAGDRARRAANAADWAPYEPGQAVFYAGAARMNRGKLDPMWTGPFEVVSVDGHRVVIKALSSGRVLTTHAGALKMADRPWADTSQAAAADRSQERWEVARILAHRDEPLGRRQYRVLWSGFTDRHRSWVDEAGLEQAPELLAAYWGHALLRGDRLAVDRPPRGLGAVGSASGASGASSDPTGNH